MSWAAAAVASAAVTVKGVQYVQDRKRAKRLEKEMGKRPVRTTNPLLEQNSAIAKNRAASSLPGYGQAVNDIDASTANSTAAVLKASNNPAAALQAISVIDNNAKNAKNKLRVQDAVYKDKGLNAVMGTNTVLANDADKNFTINKMQPYMTAAAAVSAMKNANKQNLNNMVNDSANIGIGVSNSYVNKNNANAGSPTVDTTATPTATPGTVEATGTYPATGTMNYQTTDQQKYQSLKAAYPEKSDYEIYQIIANGG